MKPWETLDTTVSPDGSRLVLARRDTEYAIRAEGRTLMSSRASRSEAEMAALVSRAVGQVQAPRVLVGGLGMGFTLRSVLDRLPASARVVCAELLPKVIEWNRGVLGDFAGRPLEDPRVCLETGDVHELLARERGAWDAVLLDVDNGPSPCCFGPNRRLYEGPGLASIRAALVPGGVICIWSVDPDPRFEGRLARAGFGVSVHRCSAHGASGTAHRGKRHTLYLARNAGGRRTA